MDPPSEPSTQASGEQAGNVEWVSITATASPDATVLGCIADADAWQGRDEIEAHAAVSPIDSQHIIASWMVRAPGGPGAIQAATSEDGGRTWATPVTLPVGRCAGGAKDAEHTSDPWVAIDGTGRAYISLIEWMPGEADGGDEVSKLTVLVSRDGGESWPERHVLSDMETTGAVLDNTAIAASADGSNTIYASATRYAGDGGPAGVSRSVDGGRTWSNLEPSPYPKDDAKIALAPQPLVGSDPKNVWIIFGHDPGGSQVASFRSSDSGKSWQGPADIAAWHRPRNWPVYPGTELELKVAPDIVSAAIDREHGRLWVAHPSADANGRPNVGLAYSVDGGITWSAGELTQANQIGWRPTLAVTESGTAAVTWYSPDTTSGRTETSGLPTIVNIAWVDASSNGNFEVLKRQTIDRFRWHPRRGGEYFLGDYHGLVASGETAVAIYSRSTPDGIRVVANRVNHPSAGDRSGDKATRE